jgi:hypothetical protein
VAKFPEVGDYVTGLGYKINSNITINGALPAGTRISISMNGRDAVTKGLKDLKDLVDNDGKFTFSFTDFFGVEAANFTGARYSNIEETYEIGITGNTEAVDTTFIINTFLFKTGSTFELEEQEFDLDAGIDAALLAVRDGMTITENDQGKIVAEFPEVGDYVTGLGYKINSSITINGALPAGTRISISMNGRDAVTKSLDDLKDLIENDGKFTFAFTDFFDVEAADFTGARYNGTTETYSISLSGNTEAVDTTFIINTFLFKTGSTFELEEQAFDLDAGIDAALLAVRDGMTITENDQGKIVAEFPEVGDYVTGLGYKINSNITINGALPAGTRISISMNGRDAVTKGLDDLKDLVENDGKFSFAFTDFFGVEAADFTGARYSKIEETYEIGITGNSEAVDTTFTISTYLFKTGSTFELEEQEFDLDVAAADTTAPWFDVTISYTGANTFEIDLRASETVTFYYVAYARDENRKNPTVDDVIAGTDGNGSNEGVNANNLGPVDVGMTGKLSLTVNTTPYDVFLAAVDLSGNKSAQVHVLPFDDTTPPAFLDAYPQAASIGENSFDVLVKASETVTYYFVAFESDLLRAPDADEVVAGTDGNGLEENLWRGQLGPLSGDTEGSMGFSHLEGSTTYDVFAVAVDTAGNKSAVKLVQITTLADVSAPVFEAGYPKAGNIAANSFDILVKANETVTYYFVAFDSDPEREPGVDDVINGTDGKDSTDNLWRGSIGPLYGEDEGKMSFLSLRGSTTYDVFVVAVDTLGHRQAAVTKLTVTTPVDTSMPSFLEGYPKAAEIRENSFKVLVNADEDVTYYIIAYDHASGRLDPSAVQVKEGTDGAGSGVNAWSGSSRGLVSGYYEFYFSFSDVEETITYDVFVVAVDTAGNISAVETVSVTPQADTTPPAFAETYPKIVNIKDHSFDVLVRADEEATFYFVAYIKDDTRSVPSVDQVIAGTDGNDVRDYLLPLQLGPLTGNTEGTKSFPLMSSASTYDVFIVAVDEAGNKQAAVTKLTVTTPADTTPPAFLEDYPKAGDIGANGFSILAQINEISTCFYVVYVHDPARVVPSADDIIRGTNLGSYTKRSAGLLVNGRENAITVSELAGSTAYDVYIVAKDSTGNKSDVKALTVTTLEDTAAPSFVPGYPYINTGVTVLRTAVKSNQPATYFCVAYVHDDDRTPPSAQDIVAGQDGDGDKTGVICGSIWDVPAFEEDAMILNGLSESTNYDVFIVARYPGDVLSEVQLLTAQTTTLVTVPVPTWSVSGNTLCINTSGLDANKITDMVYVYHGEFYDSNDHLLCGVSGFVTGAPDDISIFMNVMPANAAYLKVRIMEHCYPEIWNPNYMDSVSDYSEILHLTVEPSTSEITSVTLNGSLLTATREIPFVTDNEYILTYADADPSVMLIHVPKFSQIDGNNISFTCYSSGTIGAMTFLELYAGAVNESGEATLTVSRQTGIMLT